MIYGCWLCETCKVRGRLLISASEIFTVMILPKIFDIPNKQKTHTKIQPPDENCGYSGPCSRIWRSRTCGFFQLKRRKVISCCMAEDVYGVGGCVWAGFLLRSMGSKIHCGGWFLWLTWELYLRMWQIVLQECWGEEFSCQCLRGLGESTPECFTNIPAPKCCCRGLAFPFMKGMAVTQPRQGKYPC